MTNGKVPLPVKFFQNLHKKFDTPQKECIGIYPTLIADNREYLLKL